MYTQKHRCFEVHNRRYCNLACAHKNMTASRYAANTSSDCKQNIRTTVMCTCVLKARLCETIRDICQTIRMVAPVLRKCTRGLFTFDACGPEGPGTVAMVPALLYKREWKTC